MKKALCCTDKPKLLRCISQIIWCSKRNHNMGSHLCQKVSIASDKTQSLVLKYRSIASDKNSIVGVIPPTKRLPGESRDIGVYWNEIVASNRILVFTQRFLGSPRGKHCNSLERNLWRKVVSTSKKTVLVLDHRFIAAVLSEMGVGNIHWKGQRKVLFEQSWNM